MITKGGAHGPRLIYGTSFKKERTCDLVMKAVVKGFRALDSSCQPLHYNEAGVGEALEKLQGEYGIRRDDIFLQTRFSPFQDYLTCPYDVNCSLALQAHRSLQSSLSCLRTNHVESFLLHSPIQPFADLMSVWKAMEYTVVDEGKVKQLGICNIHDLDLLKQIHAEARDIKPTVVQNRLYANTHFDKDIREWCSNNGVEYQAFWVLNANTHITASPTVMGIATELGYTPAQIFFRFWIQEGVTPLTGTTNELHMEQALQTLNFTLSEADCNAIRKLTE